ncbi:MAG TPA: heme o synthase [Solirubrobacteraceae bacterium]|nr:heme o synthase [Solirubrobacteraceae bacterium]
MKAGAAAPGVPGVAGVPGAAGARGAPAAGRVGAGRVGAGRVRVGAGPSAWRDYVTLTKPRIMSLLVLTAVCAMVAAAAGAPALPALLAVVIGGGLACGGASALNHVIDRDIDRLMGPRTAARPVAAGRISPRRAVAFAAVLLASSFAVMTAFDNLLAAALALSGGAYYVVVYTLWLKRSTPQNIVIGGAAGAIPTLSGWAAASGHLGLGAVFLFAIVLLWTPPHFWALALLLERQYAAAQIPMMPVVRGARATARQVLAYSFVLVAVTLVPGLIGTFGVAYLVAALALGAVFIGLAWRLWREGTPARAAVLFHFSLLYLALLFVAVALDAALR